MIKTTTLDNGLVVITQKDESANTVSLSYTVKCGSYQEGTDELGIAHFTEHMLFKGTVNRSAREISEAIEGVGGILNAETSFHYTRFWCTLPCDYWKDGVDVLSDIMWNNLIPEDEFIKEKQVILEELKMYDDDPGSKIFELLITGMHPSYYNRRLQGGNVKTVSKLTKQQMEKFIDRFYVPDNIVFIATGNIDHDELVKLIKESCDGIEFIKNDVKDKIEFIPDKLGQKDLVRRMEIQQSHLAWGLFGPKVDDNDYIVGTIISLIMGGNSSSRLYQIIREQQGLAYTVGMDLMGLRDISIFSGYVGLDGNNIKLVKDIVVKELNKLTTTLVDTKELERAKAFAKGTLLIYLETTKGKSSYLNESVLTGIDCNYEDYIKKIEYVSPENIKEFANKYFKKDNIVFAQIIPKNIN